MRSPHFTGEHLKNKPGMAGMPFPGKTPCPPQRRQYHALMNRKQCMKGLSMAGKDKIKMYGLSTCFHCKSLINLFNELGLDVEVVNVDLSQGEERKELVAEVKQFNKRCTFPTTSIGQLVVVGYKEDEIRKAIEEQQ
jgi:glutaredoxin-like protein NrdH